MRDYKGVGRNRAEKIQSIFTAEDTVIIELKKKRTVDVSKLN